MGNAVRFVLTDRARSALRAGDAVNGRINQVVDRYLEIIANYQAQMIDHFSEEQRRELVAAYRQAKVRPAAEVWEVSGDMIKILGLRSPLGLKVDHYDLAELFALFELLESDFVLAAADHG